jgi:hypothetical protein
MCIIIVLFSVFGRVETVFFFGFPVQICISYWISIFSAYSIFEFCAGDKGEQGEIWFFGPVINLIALLCGLKNEFYSLR